MLRRFRAALAVADAAPSEETIAVLRQAALPLLDQLRAAYAAAGSPYGDHDGGLFRWLGEVIALRGHETAELQDGGSTAR
jgi:hypothetical protein